MREKTLPPTSEFQASWRVAALVIAICTVTWICVQPQVSNDFWMQAKVGEWIVQNRAVPHNLLFPFTEVRQQVFHAHEWLVSVVFFLAIQTFGENGLPLLLGALGLALLALTVTLSAKRADAGVSLGLLCGFLALLVENYRHFLRPELLSLFLFLAYWAMLDAFAARHSYATALGACVLVVIWANSHGSFILAPLMAMVYAIGAGFDKHRQRGKMNLPAMGKWNDFAALAIASLLCCLINPAGWELLQFVFNFSNSSVSKQMVLEWMPTFDTRLRHVPGLWIGVICGIVLATISALNWQRLRSADLLLLLLFLTLGLIANRFLVYLGFVAAMLLPVIYADRTQRVQSRLHATTCLVALLVLGWSVLYGNVNGNYPYKTDFQEIFSTPMIRTLSSPDLRGAVFTSYDLGAELTYRAYPRLQASIDSRIDSYGDDYFFYHEQLLGNVELMTEFINRYNVRYMLLTYSDFRKFQELKLWRAGQWQPVMVDTRAVLLERNARTPSKPD